MSDAREKFITHILDILISQREVWNIHTWTKQAQDIYDFGVQRAIACMLSITDSRPLNEGPYRLTTASGEIIEFFPVDGGPGVIVEIEERYKKLLGI